MENTNRNKPDSQPPRPKRRGFFRRQLAWLLACLGVNPGERPWEEDSNPPSPNLPDQPPSPKR
jgi:hypothetical protein